MTMSPNDESGCQVHIQCDKFEFTAFRQHILTMHVPGFDCNECKMIIKPKDLVIECSECNLYNHKKCTNLSRSQGAHWKPKGWKCQHCSEQTHPASMNNVVQNPIAGKHRKSNLNISDPKTEFLQSQLDSCRGIIAQR